MTKEQAKQGMKVRSIVNPDRHYVIVGIYETYAKCHSLTDRVKTDLNIDYQYLTPLEDEK